MRKGKGMAKKKAKKKDVSDLVCPPDDILNRRYCAGQFQTELHDLIDRHSKQGDLMLCEVIGMLDVAKYNAYARQNKWKYLPADGGEFDGR